MMQLNKIPTLIINLESQKKIIDAPIDRLVYDFMG